MKVHALRCDLSAGLHGTKNDPQPIERLTLPLPQIFNHFVNAVLQRENNKNSKNNNKKVKERRKEET